MNIDDDFDCATGHCPLTYAVSKNLEGITKLLLDNKANPNHQNQKDGNILLLYIRKLCVTLCCQKNKCKYCKYAYKCEYTCSPHKQ